MKESLYSICAAEMVARGIDRTQLFNNLRSSEVGDRAELLAALIDGLSAQRFPDNEDAIVAIRAGLAAMDDSALERRLFAAAGYAMGADTLQGQGSHSQPCHHGP